MLDMSLQNSLEFVQIEPFAFRDKYDNYRNGRKAEMSYDESLRRLNCAGFDRHLRTSEFFHLKRNSVKGTLTGVLLTAHNDIVQNAGILAIPEWFGLAVKLKNNGLFVYSDPDGVVWNGHCYVVPDSLSYSAIRRFDISGKESYQRYGLKEFNDQFVNFVCGCSLHELPEELINGGNAVKFLIPPEGEVWPVNTDFFVDKPFDNCFFGASRGVRVKN